MTKGKMTVAEAMEMMSVAFDEPLERLVPELGRDAIQGWDSMGALMLIAEIDERFGIELTAETSLAMRSVNDVLDFLRRHDLLLE